MGAGEGRRAPPAAAEGERPLPAEGERGEAGLALPRKDGAPAEEGRPRCAGPAPVPRDATARAAARAGFIEERCMGGMGCGGRCRPTGRGSPCTPRVRTAPPTAARESREQRTENREH